MTEFKTQFIVTEEQLHWLRSEYARMRFLMENSTDLSFEHYDTYIYDYEARRWDYRNFDWMMSRVAELDESVVDDIYNVYGSDDENNKNEDDDENGENDDENENKDEDSEIDEEAENKRKERDFLLSEFSKFTDGRQEYFQEAQKHILKYSRLGFFIDSFTNFDFYSEEIDKNKFRVTFSSWPIDDDEYIRNPIFLALFLQKFMHEYSIFKPMKFKYIEGSQEVRERTGGLVIIGYFDIDIFSLDDLMKPEIPLKLSDLLPNNEEENSANAA